MVTEVMTVNTMGGFVPGYVLHPDDVRDLRPMALDDNGDLRILPASFWAETTREERMVLGTRTGTYGFPTVELVEYLKREIGDRKAIEIGAGTGILGRAVGIISTDSHIQVDPEMSAVYRDNNIVPVKYGEHVEKLEARAAISKHKPSVVIAQWVTHRFDPRRSAHRGFSHGVDENWLLQNVKRYIFIGNQKVHMEDAPKPILSKPHTIERPDWLYSRAANPTPNVIITWQGKK